MGNAKKILFARVVSRASVCDVCEDTQFVYFFDEKGKITNLVPIKLGKDGNEQWDENDLRKIKSRIVGRYITETLEFNARVDAISTATVTSALIFVISWP